jgi:GNAT superfamily N-acetyltransferase
MTVDVVTQCAFRSAVRGDTPIILQLIRELAVYEKLEHEVVADEAMLAEFLFGERPYAEVLIAEVDGDIAGFCLFFHNFSTFLGKPGIYIEDIFVRPEYRGQGIGKKFFAEISAIAESRNCGRVEWWVLDWNKPAITFYERMDAVAMDEWTVYRLTEEKYKRLKSTI